MSRLLLERAGFRRLWLGTNISMLGDWLSLVAVSHFSLQHESGAIALALTLAAHVLPRSLLSPLAGTLADRLDRRSVLLVVTTLQAVITVMAALSAMSGALFLLQALIAVRSALSAVDVPAQQAALRHVVEPKELAPANTFVASTWSVTFALGMAVGGFIAGFGATTALLIDAATFVVALLILRKLPAMPGASKPDGGRRQDGSFAAVLARTLGTGALFEVTFAKTPIALLGGAGWIALNLVADEFVVLGGAGVALGTLQAIRGVGTGVGAWPLSYLRQRGIGAKAIYAVAMTSAIIGMVGLSASDSIGFAGAMALVWGAGSGLNWVQSTTSLQERAATDTIGRLAALDQLSFTASMTLSALLGAAIGQGRPVETALVGVVLGGLGYVVWWLGRTRRRDEDRWVIAT